MPMFKTLVHNTLKQLGWAICRYDKGKPGFTSLLHDLPLFVTCSAPRFFDVGANKGQTIAWMKRLFPRSIIDAFEPCRSVADEFIRPLTASDPSIHLHVCALSDHAGDATFYEYGNNELSSLHTLDDSHSAWFREEALVSTNKVPLCTVDSFASSHHIQKIDLLKIDTQGGDLAVLRGATDSLRNSIVNWVMVEVNFAPLYKNQPSFADIDAFLAGHGFRLVALYDVLRGPDCQPLAAWATAVYGKVTAKS